MVTWHGLLTAVGVVVSAYAARHYARRFGFNADIVWTLLPYVALAAIVGGRLAYVGANLAEFRLTPLEALRIDRGGLGSFGALIGALAALVVFARVRRLPTWRLADALAIAIPINYLSMRVGNFLIGELYGDVSSLPWARRRSSCSSSAVPGLCPSTAFSFGGRSSTSPSSGLRLTCSGRSGGPSDF